jgi:hypothetical protein
MGKPKNNDLERGSEKEQLPLPNTYNLKRPVEANKAARFDFL